MSRQERRLSDPEFIPELLDFYQEEYENDTDWSKLVEKAKGHILSTKPNFKISACLMLYMFGKPEIAIQFPEASLSTILSFNDAVENKDTKRISESIFFIFIDEENGEIKTTKIQQKPAAYDLPIPKIETFERFHSQTMIVTHTHPQLNEHDILKPSVYIEHNGKLFGDLLAFLSMRRHPEEFISNPMLIIMQNDVTKNAEKMLFIQEGTVLNFTDVDSYINQLINYKNLMERAQTEEEVLAILRKMGYKASLLEIDNSHLFGAFPIVSKQLEQVSEDLDLPFK